jgi:hypothetical protein
MRGGRVLCNIREDGPGRSRGRGLGASWVLTSTPARGGGSGAGHRVSFVCAIGIDLLRCASSLTKRNAVRNGLFIGADLRVSADANREVVGSEGPTAWGECGVSGTSLRGATNAGEDRAALPLRMGKVKGPPTQDDHKFIVASLVSRRLGRTFSDLVCSTGARMAGKDHAGLEALGAIRISPRAARRAPASRGADAVASGGCRVRRGRRGRTSGRRWPRR